MIVFPGILANIAEVQGRRVCSMHTRHLYGDTFKEERRSSMCAYETNRLHCELAMLLFLWLFGVPSIFAIL